MKIWDPATDVLLGQMRADGRASALAGFTNRNGRSLLISASYNGPVKVWDITDPSGPACLSVLDLSEPVHTVTPIGTNLAPGLRDGLAIVAVRRLIRYRG